MDGKNVNSNSNFALKATALFSLATIAFYLLTEHKAHLLAYSSYIIFGVFVLMHLFMCGRHGSHGGHGEQGGHCGHGGEKHKHNETEKGTERDAEVHDDTGQHGHSQHEHGKGSL